MEESACVSIGSPGDRECSRPRRKSFPVSASTIRGQSPLSSVTTNSSPTRNNVKETSPAGDNSHPSISLRKSHPSQRPRTPDLTHLITNQTPGSAPIPCSPHKMCRLPRVSSDPHSFPRVFGSEKISSATLSLMVWTVSHASQDMTRLVRCRSLRIGTAALCGGEKAEMGDRQ